MRFERIPLTLAPLLLSLAFAQRSDEKSGSPWQAPAAASAVKNPLADRPQAAGGGRKLFQRNCAECHGRDGAGTGRAPNLHAASVQDQSDGALFWKITGGNTARGMPSWSRLPEAQRWQLILFLRTLPHR
jgi:mono/diheme cytochrome c family protein